MITASKKAAAPQASPAPTDGQIFDLDPRRVKPFAAQPRKRFRGIAQLAESIRLVGQVTPIVVTTAAEADYDAELVDGERRLRACLEGNLRVRAVFDRATAEERYVRSVAANFCRQGHDAVEIMEAVLSLRKAGRSVAQIAGMTGKTATWVIQYASLRKLAPELLEKLKAPPVGQTLSKAQRRARGRLTLSVALLLIPLARAQQIAMLRKIEQGQMSMAQARTFVRRFAASKGVPVGKRQSDRSKFKAVRSAIETCSHVVDRYLDMPGVEIQGLVRNASLSERQELVGRLEKLCENLLMLSDALKVSRTTSLERKVT